jgi:hypothetical protein
VVQVWLRFLLLQQRVILKLPSRVVGIAALQPLLMAWLLD